MEYKDFKDYILSIGFEICGYEYEIGTGFKYKQFRIILWGGVYDLYNKEYMIENIPIINLEPLKKIERSIKLKKMLK